ncbi:uracil-DNA glycosylase family protein [Achromobacter xylosoxidans]|uniref:uracil-DNA glycosylase family protein n=1 Tax=Alcaligenes xylosoxydans xylosoxydans TaxID=85698 RepID=UPI0012A91970|nr:uracil-DNA glycosylase family protein [Achromobacter xylosoxidans]CUR69908.1 uracil-DNA glycosylase family domain protein [Achromobacter xylosoxidans]
MNAHPRSADDADDEIDPDQHPRKLADCRRCGLWRNATQAVGGEGKRRMHKSPAQAEIAACGYWLEQELDDIRPRVIIALGATALGALVPDRKLTLKAALGQSLRRGNTPVLVAYHPSFALRSPDPESRQAAFQTIVEALRRAGRQAGRA